LVPQSKKGTAKCDKSCELQNPVNHRILERKLHPRDIPRVCLFECRPQTVVPPGMRCRGRDGDGVSFLPLGEANDPLKAMREGGLILRRRARASPRATRQRGIKLPQRGEVPFAVAMRDPARRDECRPRLSSPFHPSPLQEAKREKGGAQTTPRPRIRQGYPLNLSISLSGGKRN
jgi:hypothetical protein